MTDKEEMGYIDKLEKLKSNIRFVEFVKKYFETYQKIYSYVYGPITPKTMQTAIADFFIIYPYLKKNGELFSLLKPLYKAEEHRSVYVVIADMLTHNAH